MKYLLKFKIIIFTLKPMFLFKWTPFLGFQKKTNGICYCQFVLGFFQKKREGFNVIDLTVVVYNQKYLSYVKPPRNILTTL